MSEETILYFRELERYGFAKLEKDLSSRLSQLTNNNGSNSKINSIINRLIKTRFLRRYKNTKENANDILDDNDQELEGDYSNDDSKISYAFSYVGLIEIDGIIIYVYPKYMDDFDDKDSVAKIDYAKKILRVLKKYKNENLDIKISDNDEDKDSSNNKLPLELFLLEDYFQNGIYNKQESVIAENGNGEIDWNRTIDETNAIIKNGKPYYTTLLTIENNSNENDFITTLHKAIISDISRKLNELGILALFDISFIELTPLTVDDLDPSDNNEYAIYLLERELRVQYITQKRQLLKTLINYLKSCSNRSDSNSLMYYGTTAFNLVFEKACADVFGDVKDKELDKLINDEIIYVDESLILSTRDENSKGLSLYDLTINGDEELVNFVNIKNKKIKENIDNPIWKFKYKSPSTKDTLKPDIIVMKKYDDNSNIFAILDAKYYQIECDNNGISGQPGVQDIVKQYAYMQAFLQIVKLLNVRKILNAFIIPKQNSKNLPNNYIDDIGNVSMGFFARLNRNLGSIKVIEVDAERLFESYLNKDNKFDAEIKKLFDSCSVEVFDDFYSGGE